MQAILELKKDRRKRCWTLNGFKTSAPLSADVEDLKESLAHQLCDNPMAQASLGILGADSFDFDVIE